MDGEQEQLKSLGFFGVLNESFKIIFSWRKIFTKITLFLIFPLSFLFLANIEFSYLLSSKVLRNADKLEETQNGSSEYNHLARETASQLIALFAFRICSLIFLLILNLLSTAAIVYTIACKYTAKDITFKKVMSAVPKVWKRLVVTFLWFFLFMFIFNVVAGILFALWGAFLAGGIIGIVVGIVLLILYLVGLVYICIIWSMACVVSVLEDVYGIKGMKKSRYLVKGKMGVNVARLVIFGVCFGGIEVLFQYVVVFGWGSPSIVASVFIGILCFLLLVVVILLGFVVQTVIYFVCKSFHNENIDKSLLGDHLEGYLGYVRLRKDVQMEQV